MRLKKLILPAYIFSSPWLLASAVGLLVIIVLTFATHNFRLEQRLMTNAMLQKATILMQVMDSGSRASYINDLRRSYWKRDAWHLHVQGVIDHLTEDPDLAFLALLDKDGKAIAHSDPKKIGRIFPLPAIQELTCTTGKTNIFYGVRDLEEYGRVFEAARSFSPALRSINPIPPLAPMRNRAQGRNPHAFMQHGTPRMPLLMPRWFDSPETRATRSYILLVGLDMHDFDRTLGRLRLQIVMLSLAMLLVGIGGWFSLSALQGYRISQKTINDMQEYTSLLVDKLPLGLVGTDASGRIATWNHALAELTGLRLQAVFGKKPQDVLPKELGVFFAKQSPTFATESARGSNHSIRLQFGDHRCELLCRPLSMRDSEGQFMGRVLLISDVTEIRSLEQRMRENERLAAVGRMAGGVAHEVRNPLSSIKGLALLLKHKFPEGGKERDMADLLIQETERMNRAITEMLSFTRPMALRLEAVNLKTLLERSLMLIKIEAEDNQIRMALAAAPDLLPVRGDMDRLQQVVMNVLLNAMQAMEQGGQMMVSLENGKRGQTVELRIIDTGGGIDRETLTQVFYPYFTTKASGSGLGLSISQKIIVDHEGRIELESEPGKGTQVLIELPVWQEKNCEEANESSAAAPEKLPNKKI